MRCAAGHLGCASGGKSPSSARARTVRGEGEGEHGAVRLGDGQRAERRAFLRSMAVVGGMGVLAACRKDVQSGGSNGSSTAAGAIPPITEETGELKIHEWAGYDAKWLWREYAKAGLPRAHVQLPHEHRGRDREDRRAASTGTSRTRRPATSRTTSTCDAIQPWDTSLISNFAELSPDAAGRRATRRRAVRDRARLGLLGRDHPHRPGRPVDQLVQLPVRRRARGAHLVVRHAVDPPRPHVTSGSSPTRSTR